MGYCRLGVGEDEKGEEKEYVYLNLEVGFKWFLRRVGVRKVERLLYCLFMVLIFGFLE